VAELERVIFEEIARLAADGPTDEEIERGRVQAEAQFMFRLQTVGGFGGKSDQLNAYNVFLLRQYFMSIPRELDEAAMIDGAGPFRILRSIIIPQSIPAITAVSLFHFFFAWNDFLVPLLYLASKPDLQPLSLGIQQFNALYSTQPTLIQAAAFMTMKLDTVSGSRPRSRRTIFSASFLSIFFSAIISRTRTSKGLSLKSRHRRWNTGTRTSFQRI